jgi:integrase
MIGVLQLARTYGTTALQRAVSTALALSCSDQAAVQHLLMTAALERPPVTPLAMNTKRDRRIGHDEEHRLLAAADKLNCAEHAYAGAPMRDRIVGALETGCRLGEMLKIQNRHVLWSTHQISIPAEHAKDAESRRIPFEPRGRLAQLLKRRRFLGPNAFAFGGPAGEYQGTIRTAWESLVLLAHGIEPTRTRARGRVNRDQLAEIDLHWHDLRHEAACRRLARTGFEGDSASARSRRSQDDAAVSERHR